MRALKQLIGHQTPKNIDEIIRESIKLRAPLQHFATVIISQGDIIQGITQSKPNNLILDNFGTVLAGLMRAPVAAVTNVSIPDITNTARTLPIYTINSDTKGWCTYAVGKEIGTQLKVGAGVTAAARADYQIETDFGTAPESGHFDSGSGSYAGGSIAVAGAIVAGGAGTINEVGFFGHWSYGAAVRALFMLFHDILVSGEAFVLGQTITAAYTINL